MLAILATCELDCLAILAISIHVRIIKTVTLDGFAKAHPKAAAGLAHWETITRAAQWKNPVSFPTLPKDYSALVALFPPRPIHDRIAYDNTADVVNAMAGHALNKDQEDYLEILSRTIEVYEAEVRPTGKVRGRKLLAALVDEHELTAADLGKIIGVDSSHAAKILRGDRSITATHAKEFARRFAVSVESLLA